MVKEACLDTSLGPLHWSQSTRVPDRIYYSVLADCANGLTPKDLIVALAEKDSERRITMSKRGYLWRLAKGFLAVSSTYVLKWL